MKKKYRKYVYLLCALLIIALVPLALHLSAGVSMKDCGDSMDKWGDYDTYELGYNSHGIKILKHPKKAIKQFKSDYAEGFRYLMEEEGFPELTSSYKSVKIYSQIAFGNIPKGTENYDEVNEQVSEIMIFGKLLTGSYWQTYTSLNGYIK